MTPQSTFRPSRRYLLAAGLLVIGLYILVPQLGDFRSSWHLLSQLSPGWTAAAVAFTGVTYLAAAATYCLLAFKPLRYGRTALIQLAVMFLNRLLPGGIGALGGNYAYLVKNRHSSTQAATMVAINNLLGFLGHNFLIFFALIFYGGNMTLRASYGHPLGLIIKFLLAATVLSLVVVLILGRQRLHRYLLELRAQLNSYRQRPFRLAGALLSSMTLTLFNVLCLYACALALGVHLNFAAVLLIFTLGIGAGTATPTPGGLGGFEAGLVAGFVAYHVPSAPALSIALLYRLISYWLALGVGALALLVARRRHYI